jgi:hypothetical protein
MRTLSHPVHALFGVVLCGFGFILSCRAAAAEPAPAFGEAYQLKVTPREDSKLKDPETGTELLFLTNAKQKDTHLYFHQRSWLADGSVILFSSNREQGGLMGYVVETGELVRITAADGAPLGNVTAAVNRNSVLGMSGDRVLEIQLTVMVRNDAGTKQAQVVGRERHICTVPGINGTFNESCDGRRIAAGQKTADTVGIVVMDEQTGKWERLCKIPEGVEYHVHVQWSTTNPNWLSFAGAPNRLWVIDTRDGVPWCPYREKPDELVTHESWWVDDQLIFCGGMHAKPTEESHVKTIDLHTGTIRIVGAGSWWPDAKPADLARRNWWHASGSPDGRWIAADNWHGDIMLFEGKTTRPRLLTANHRTYGGGEHPEVGWDRKGEQVVFGSHKIGGMTVCVATIPAAWQREAGQMRVGLEAKQQTGP